MSEEAKHAVLDVRVQNLEKVVDRVSNAVESIDQSLKILAQLEVEHRTTREGLNRAFASIGKQDTRITAVEIEMPMLKMIKGWVITGAIGIIGLVGLAVFALVLK